MEETDGVPPGLMEAEGGGNDAAAKEGERRARPHQGRRYRARRRKGGRRRARAGAVEPGAAQETPQRRAL